MPTLGTHLRDALALRKGRIFSIYIEAEDAVEGYRARTYNLLSRLEDQGITCTVKQRADIDAQVQRIQRGCRSLTRHKLIWRPKALNIDMKLRHARIRVDLSELHNLVDDVFKVHGRLRDYKVS